MAAEQLSRRAALRLLAAAGAGVLLGGCADGRPVGADLVRAAEDRRPDTGRTVTATLRAAPAEIDIAGQVVRTWTYGGALPGAVLRATVGDRLRVRLDNALPEPTSVHWHGLAVRNDVDGAPGLTTPEVPAGGSAGYEFLVATPGTHWLHPHHGLQLDRGLYAPLVVDDPDEPGDWDDEVLVVLDDWTDGLGASPEEVYAQLRSDGAAHGRSAMPGMTGMPGVAGHGGGGTGAARTPWSAGDWPHPLHLANGRSNADPDGAAVTPGGRVRLRIVNAAADTAYRVAVLGHRLRVTHTDGFPVEPVDGAAVLLGMGERADATVVLTEAVASLVAVPEGKAGTARMVLRTSTVAAAPPAVADDAVREEVVAGEVVLPAALRATEAVRLPGREPDRVADLVLAGGMGSYRWTINGRTYDETRPLRVRPGERLRLRVSNHSMMAHPLHLHGHTAQVVRDGGAGAGNDGARKDTVLVAPRGGLALDLDADNPGRWMVHCHNAYHAEAGMMTRLDYRT